MLQCCCSGVVVCGSVLQDVVVYCSVAVRLQRAKGFAAVFWVCCSVVAVLLQNVVVYCSVLSYIAIHGMIRCCLLGVLQCCCSAVAVLLIALLLQCCCTVLQGAVLCCIGALRLQRAKSFPASFGSVAVL